MAIIGALPVTLTNGTIADATQVMADFNYILGQVNANAAPITGGTYLPLAGGTMTGNLNVNSAVGTSSVTLNGFTASALVLNAPAGTLRAINGQTAGLNRWQMQLGSGGAETGSPPSTGSDFVLNRYNDAGVLIDTPLTITRSTGQVTIPDGIALSNTVASNVRNFIYQTSGSNRWLHGANTTAEGGSNVGSDWGLFSYTDGGVFLATPISVKRSTGVTTFSVAIVNGPSDRSLKENIAPLEGSLDKVLTLQGVSFNMIGDEDKRRHIGLIAQDVAPIVPEVIQDFRSTVPAPDGKGEPVEVSKLALDYPKLTALLIEAVKTLTARIETLEAKLAT